MCILLMGTETPAISQSEDAQLLSFRSVGKSLTQLSYLQCPWRASQGKFLQDRSSLVLGFQMPVSRQHRAGAAHAASTNPSRTHRHLEKRS